MNKQAERTNHCDNYCNWFYRCNVHWGAECKRQGGKKIPRMKQFAYREYNRGRLEPEVKKVKQSRIKEVLNAVKTKVVGW